MTDETPAAEERPKGRNFRRPFNAVRLDPAAAVRQGRAATLAWEKFRDSAAVIAFLNTHDDALGARPIDLAVASNAGLEAVERVLAKP